MTGPGSPSDKSCKVTDSEASLRKCNGTVTCIYFICLDALLSLLKVPPDIISAPRPPIVYKNLLDLPSSLVLQYECLPLFLPVPSLLDSCPCIVIRDIPSCSRYRKAADVDTPSTPAGSDIRSLNLEELDVTDTLLTLKPVIALPSIMA